MSGYHNLDKAEQGEACFLEINLKGGELVGCESKGGGGADPIRGGVGNIGSEISTQTLPEHDQRHLQHKPSPLQHPQYHLEHNPSSPLHAQEQHHPQHQSRELNNDCLGQGGILFW